MIFNEAKLFLDWYVPKFIKKNKRYKIKKKFKKKLSLLISKNYNYQIIHLFIEIFMYLI